MCLCLLLIYVYAYSLYSIVLTGSPRIPLQCIPVPTYEKSIEEEGNVSFCFFTVLEFFNSANRTCFRGVSRALVDSGTRVRWMVVVDDHVKRSKKGGTK